jgi:hypothetical protein
MADGTAKPVIFISYSHKDELEHPRDGEVQWLSFVRTYLQPAVKHGVFDLFVDEHLPGGADLKPEIERKLRACDVFIPLISANSTASDYIVDTEIKVTRDREAKGENVCFYPILLTPTPKVALDKFKDKVIRPRDAKPLSSFPYGERIQKMTEIADEIAKIAAEIVSLKPGPPNRGPQPSYVHISGLPETPYERLVGRDDELKRLDEAWADAKTNILSLIAEGGAGKSALVNEWLKRLQADSYRGAEAVLGWSFYSQGTKERATSADEFLNWALEKLGIKLDTTSATAKGETIAEAMMQRRVLLVLDGVEPLQHGLDTQLGQLRDQGLRALLRRFASTSPAQAHGLIALTSRLAVKDIARWEDGATPVVDVERLSDEAGAALLRDNGVWGTDKELKAAAHDFRGHPLALGLLASLLEETQKGDTRRRGNIRQYFPDAKNPGYDHARRVMESYEKEWLSGQPVLLAIMHMIGLFDRPASGNCLKALRAEPAIEGLTDRIVKLDEAEWQRAITRLREVRLLAPPDPAAPDALDAHPLVREWFGERFQHSNEVAWKAGHGRLYEHLRDTTKEGKTPTLEDLAPLYQAIAHGCRADQHNEALFIYTERICRRMPSGDFEFYSKKKLGAWSSDLSCIWWLFEKPYEVPFRTIDKKYQSWLLGDAAWSLRAQGRLMEALPVWHIDLTIVEKENDWHNAATVATNLSECETHLGELTAALANAREAVTHARRTGEKRAISIARANLAASLHMIGQFGRAAQIFRNLERDEMPLVSMSGYSCCNLLIDKGNWEEVRKRAKIAIDIAQRGHWLADVSTATMTLGRSSFGLALQSVVKKKSSKVSESRASDAWTQLCQGVEGLRATGWDEYISRGLVARAAFHRGVGDWDGAARDLDEVEEIAEPGPMRLFLCDTALERARLAFTKIEAFAPLNGMAQWHAGKEQSAEARRAERRGDRGVEERGREAAQDRGRLHRKMRLSPARRGTRRAAGRAARREEIRRPPAAGVRDSLAPRAGRGLG